MKKYNYRSAWSKMRAINLKFGFAIALVFVLFAFQWEVQEKPARQYVIEIDEGILDMTQEIPIVKQKKVVPPAPAEVKSFIPKEVILTDFVIDEVDDSIDEDLIDDFIDENAFEGIDFGKGKSINESKIEIIPDENIDEIFVIAQEMPLFDDCDLTDKKDREACSNKAILEYIYDQINYPSYAREIGIEGSVVATMVISKTGKVEQIEIVRELGGGCSQEVLRVLENMPDWIPGMNNFKAVNVKITVPVKFRLK